MFCHKCGKEFNREDSYCPYCGTANKLAAKTDTTAKSGGKVIAVIAIVLVCVMVGTLLLAGIGVLAWYLYNKDAEEGAASSVSQYEDNVLSGNRFETVYNRYGDFVLPGSDSRYLCYGDIDGMSEEELTVAEQEIYARYGRMFSDPDLQAYFEARDWYPDTAQSFSPNTYEQANLDLIRVYRAKADGSLFQSGNIYVNALPKNGDYVIRDSGIRALTEDDLRGLSEEQLCVARNEILARHGWIFDNADLRDYFYARSWYVPSIPGTEFDYGVLSAEEQANISLISYYEELREGGLQWTADNPYKDVYYKYQYQNFIFADSSTRRLQKSEFDGMTEYELTIARNEIYARNGYTFKSHNLMEYYQHRSWYNPTLPVGSNVNFTSVEKANIDLIREAEREAELSSDLTYHYYASDLTDPTDLDTTLGYTYSGSAFSVKLPNYWKNYASAQQLSNGIVCYEKASMEAGCGGLLFELVMWNGEYDYLPNYTYLGTMTSPEGETFPLIRYGPSDVQFAMENMVLYNYMENDISRIMATIQAINGWTFTPA